MTTKKAITLFCVLTTVLCWGFVCFHIVAAGADMNVSLARRVAATGFGAGLLFAVLSWATWTVRGGK